MASTGRKKIVFVLFWQTAQNKADTTSWKWAISASRRPCYPALKRGWSYLQRERERERTTDMLWVKPVIQKSKLLPYMSRLITWGCVIQPPWKLLKTRTRGKLFAPFIADCHYLSCKRHRSGESRFISNTLLNRCKVLLVAIRRSVCGESAARL